MPETPKPRVDDLELDRFIHHPLGYVPTQLYEASNEYKLALDLQDCRAELEEIWTMLQEQETVSLELGMKLLELKLKYGWAEKGEGT